MIGEWFIDPNTHVPVVGRYVAVSGSPRPGYNPGMFILDTATGIIHEWQEDMDSVWAWREMPYHEPKKEPT